MPLVSVIVPAYNAQRTIGETLQSVFDQTFTDFELIVINDGSIDNTPEIVSSFTDPRLNFFSYPNAGVSASRNRGVSHAGGEYISFIDADDLWTSDKLEGQIEALQSHPQAAVAYSWTNCIDQFGRFVERDERITLSGNVYAEILVRYFLESGSNALITRQAFTEIGGFDESSVGGEDWDFFIRLAARYPFVHVPKLGILYRISQDSASAKILRHEQECLQVIHKSFEQAPEALKHLKKRTLANFYQYLSFKAIEGSLVRDKGKLAARYYWYALSLDRSLLKRRIAITFKVYLKILAAITLPSHLNQMLLDAWKSSKN